MEEILKQLLEKIGSGTGSSVEDSIKAFAVEMGLNEEEMSEIQVALTSLDAINEKASDLAKKRKEGMTLDGWTREQLRTIEEKSGDKAQEVIDGIKRGVEEGLNNTLTQNI